MIMVVLWEETENLKYVPSNMEPSTQPVMEADIQKIEGSVTYETDKIPDKSHSPSEN